jgi:hypothetical protein
MGGRKYTEKLPEYEPNKRIVSAARASIEQLSPPSYG